MRKRRIGNAVCFTRILAGVRERSVGVYCCYCRDCCAVPLLFLNSTRRSKRGVGRGGIVVTTHLQAILDLLLTQSHIPVCYIVSDYSYTIAGRSSNTEFLISHAISAIGQFKEHRPTFVIASITTLIEALFCKK